MLRLIVLSVLVVTVLGAATPRGSERIIGGSDVTDIRDAHFAVSIRYKGAHICGGAIITQQHVITAAECVKGLYVYDLMVYAEKASMFDQYPFEPYLLYVNAHYDAVTRANNVAILKVKTKFNIFDPIIIDNYDPGADWEVITFGWGATSDSATVTGLSPILQQANMAIIDRTQCKADNFNILDTMSCTDSSTTGMCRGDFGGPLIDTIQGYPRLLGVAIQSSLYCGNKAKANVFFMLESVRPWIKSIAGV